MRPEELKDYDKMRQTTTNYDKDDKKMQEISPKLQESSQSPRSTLLSSSPTLLVANFRIAAIWRLDEGKIWQDMASYGKLW